SWGVFGVWVPFDVAALEGVINNYQEFTGRAAEQTDEFLEEVVAPVLEKYQYLIGGVDASLKV
ncbi:MAG: hypothetical protein D3916_07260, partial [Candidatus Electrothrix sp. MAN1_4]|nr:hypothetical protein [Candidatus Electrothrix sp. MAN1_4]